MLPAPPLSIDHTIDGAVMAAPNWSSPLAAKGCVPPSLIVGDDGLMVMLLSAVTVPGTGLAAAAAKLTTVGSASSATCAAGRARLYRQKSSMLPRRFGSPVNCERAR